MARPRLAYIDRLKALMVAMIIAGHGAVAYGGLESAWPYQDVQETSLGAASDFALSLVVVLIAMFVMGLFFLISGLVTVPSLDRKGPRRFARDRLVRLGIPLVVWVLLLWPAAIWLAHVAAGRDDTFWDLVTKADPPLDAGPMWFVLVLLLFSLAYAGLVALERGGRRRAAVSGRDLVRLAIAVSVATVLIRPLLPAASGQPGQSHVWQWPQFIAMFSLGVLSARRGGLSPVPDRIRRRAGRAALAALGGVLLVVAAIGAAGVDGDVVFEPGVHWAPLALAVLEGPLAVGACVWLLGTAQRRLDRPLGPFERTASRSAYGAFLLQGLVLIGLMIALRPLAVPAELKALVVAGLGVAGSFALSWALVTRTAIGRVL
jgi:hypothetical protein